MVKSHVCLHICGLNFDLSILIIFVFVCTTFIVNTSNYKLILVLIAFHMSEFSGIISAFIISMLLFFFFVDHNTTVDGPYEQVHFLPPMSREEVFHTSLPHATNPIQFTIKYEKKKLRHSGSSFEDMELENSMQFHPPFQTK